MHVWGCIYNVYMWTLTYVRVKINSMLNTLNKVLKTQRTHTHTHTFLCPLESAYWDNETMTTAAYGSLSGLCIQSIHSLFSVIRVVIILRCVPLWSIWGVFHLLAPVASVNQAIIEKEVNSVVHNKMLTTWAKHENSLACWKKCLHILQKKTMQC